MSSPFSFNLIHHYTHTHGNVFCASSISLGVVSCSSPRRFSGIFTMKLISSRQVYISSYVLNSRFTRIFFSKIREWVQRSKTLFIKLISNRTTISFVMTQLFVTVEYLSTSCNLLTSTSESPAAKSCRKKCTCCRHC